MKLEYINYIGQSMNPTLKSGDLLQIVPYGDKKNRRGDVIVFISPEGCSKIIHRIVSVNSQRIKTRGDNCNRVDPWLLSHDQILGRVISTQRGNRRRRIIGGPLGQFYAAAVRAIHAIDSGVSQFLRPAYHWLVRNDVFRRYMPDQIKPRVISLNRAAGKELQLLMGRRVIGRWLPGMTRWYIRRPFRLFVDEDALPENTAEVSGVPPEADQVSGSIKDM